MPLARPLRPSAAHQWMNCALPAYAPLDRPEEDGDAAREGTCAAWVAECIRNGDATCAEDLLGRVHKNGWAVDEEMVRHINHYLSILPPDGSAEYFMQTEHLQGTADDIGGHVSHVIITDLKYGYRIVEAMGNWQLLCYLWLYVMTKQHSPATVTLRIFQPRAIHNDGPLRSWTLSYAEYMPMIDQITARINELVGGENTAHPGSHCSYCMHAVGCHALTHSVYKVMDITTSSRVYQQPDARQLSDEMDLLERMSDLLKARKDAVEEELTYRMNAGAYVPDWVIAPRYGKKKFKVEDGVIAMVTGIDPTETKTCTPAELIRRGADKTVVNSITETPRIGHKLQRYAGADKIAEAFRQAKLK